MSDKDFLVREAMYGLKACELAGALVCDEASFAARLDSLPLRRLLSLVLLVVMRKINRRIPLLKGKQST